MGSALRPINPCQSSVRVPLRKLDADKSWQVVFITVTSISAMFVEQGEVQLVRHYFSCKGTVYLEPLGPFSPLRKPNQWPHSGTVPASPHWTWEIIGFYEGFGRVDEVVINGREVEQRNA
ncbi:hypothetical protein V8G54_002509 [Vigna mungo]|uniref:Uncharacterized protein n=1 Tax=Vigna mungo TaxID=3915 RepID=A0AAQ3PAA9_VIGMU